MYAIDSDNNLPQPGDRDVHAEHIKIGDHLQILFLVEGEPVWFAATLVEYDSKTMHGTVVYSCDGSRSEEDFQELISQDEVRFGAKNSDEGCAKPDAKMDVDAEENDVSVLASTTKRKSERERSRRAERERSRRCKARREAAADNDQTLEECPGCGEAFSSLGHHWGQVRGKV